jgi:hypothetical protein
VVLFKIVDLLAVDMSAVVLLKIIDLLAVDMRLHFEPTASFCARTWALWRTSRISTFWPWTCCCVFGPTYGLFLREDMDL